MNHRNFKRMISIILAVMLIASLAACNKTSQPSASTSPASNGTPAPAAAGEPIKIGVLCSLTGSDVATGPSIKNGIELFVKENGNLIGGRPVELVIEDTASDAATCLTKTKKLVEKDGVNFLVGPLTTPQANAIMDYVSQKKIPLFTTCQANALTQAKKTDTIYRVSCASDQVEYALADYAYNTLKYRKVAVYSIDNAYGYENVGAFQLKFEDLGGTIVKKIWAPMGTKDNGPYLSQIPKDIDALFIVETGAEAINFYSDYSSYNMLIPLIGPNADADENNMVNFSDAANGLINAGNFSPYSDSAKTFKEAYNKEFNSDPSYVAAGTYAAGIIIDQIVKTLGDDATDSAKVVNALKTMSVTTPWGALKFDDYNNPVEDIYIMKCEKVDGKFRNSVIYTYKDQDQFGSYGAEAVLARPAFSKDYPPVK
jgi:branched-chain amino acid transport system substrate-binding protein